MTAPSIADVSGADETLHCYRHPDRETWVRCGRCDRPICPRCAMQGPVGLRCKQCGKPSFDPLTSFTPIQFAAGSATAIGAGILAGFIANQIGFFSIFVAFFAGGFIAEAVTRATGYKRGPVMFAILFGGIIVGTAIGAAVSFSIDYGSMAAAIAEATAAAGEDGVPDERVWLDPFIREAVTWALVSAAAACAGAWSRVR